ncbi:MAG: lipopolysaccharide export system protein LptC [bacterium]
MLTRLLSRYWLLLPVLILVVISVDRIETPLAIEVEETIDMRQTRSDYYLAAFKTRKFRADGSLEYTIQGETLAHYPDNDRSEIIAPHIELNRPEATWDISSLKARFDTNPDLFTMRGEVVMHRRRNDTEPITITTELLTVATESNQVSTDADIEIVSAHWALKATGMTSAIDDGTLTLLSSVTARYEAPSQ